MGGEPGAFNERLELGPRDLGVHASAEAAIGTGDDILASEHPGESQNAVRHKLGVLDDVGRVADDSGDQDLAFGQLDVLPDLPLMRVANIAGLDRERSGAHLKQHIDNVAQRQVGGVRPVPAAQQM